MIATDDDCNGGTAHLARQLALGLGGSFQVDFACRRSRHDSLDLSELEQHRIGIKNYHVDSSDILQQAHNILPSRRLLEETGADVVLCVDSNVSSLIALKRAAHLMHVPFVAVVNAIPGNWHEDYRRFVDATVEWLGRAAAIVFVASAHCSYFETRIARLTVPQTVIRNFCHEKFFAPRDSEVRARIRDSMGVGAADLLCLTAARITRGKGQGVCLRALGTLRETDAAAGRVHLVVAGAGTAADLQLLHEDTKRLDIGSQVSFLGQRRDIADLLDASDCFVLASSDEGAPLSIIEAMAKGVPIVASAVGDVAMMVDASCGVIVPSPAQSEDRCAARLAEVLQELHGDRKRLAGLAAGARERAPSMFSPQAALDRYGDLLAEVVADRKSGGGRSVATGRRSGRIGPRMIDFSNPDQAWSVLTEGWSGGDLEGVWTQGASSTMQLRVPAAGRPVRLRFLVKPFIASSHQRQCTEIYANGIRVGVWDTSRPGSQRLEVEIDAIGPGADIELDFRHGLAASPSALGLGRDQRKLSFFFRRLHIGPRPRTISEAAVIALRTAWSSAGAAARGFARRIGARRRRFRRTARARSQ